jgi:hypothetical protein
MATRAIDVEATDEFVRTSARIPKELHDGVEACARAMGISINAAITTALIDFVASEDHRARVREFFTEGQDRFEALLNKLASG